MKFAARTAVSFKAAMFLGVASVAVIAASPAQAQAAETKTLDIPAQPLASTLTQIGRQTGSEVVFQPADVRGHRAPAVRGALTPDQALSAALQGSGLSARRTAQGAYVIEQDAASGNAQTAAGDDYRGNEIIVTAQKRAEAVQDVPIAITALSQKNLEEQKIEGGPDIMRAVPNLTFSKSNFTGYNLSIRGIGSKAVSATTDPGVAVAFNHTGLIHNRFFEQEFFDVERVEILRGPQGTLYGRNATGGVVNLITTKPKLHTFEGSIKGEVGNYESRRMVAMLNVPIVPDELGLRVAGAMTQRDGYDYNSITQNRINGRDLWSLRTTLGFEKPGIRGNIIWERFREDDNRSRTGKQLCHRDEPAQSIGSTPLVGIDQFADLVLPGVINTGCKAGSLYDEGAFGTPFGLSNPAILSMVAYLGQVVSSRWGFLPDGSTGALIKPMDPYAGVMQSRNLREVASVRDPRYRAGSDILTLNLDVDLSDSLTLSSQTAYNWDKVYSFQDFNRFNSLPVFNDTSSMFFDVAMTQPSHYANVAPGGVFCDPQIGCSDRIAAFDISRSKSTQFAQEIRLASSFDGPFNFSVGANYTKFKTLNEYFVMNNVLTAIAITHPFNGSADTTTCDKTGPIFSPFQGTPVPIGESSYCPYIDPNPVESINGEGHNYFLSRNPYRVQSTGLFGEFYWDINDAWRLTGGLRYTDDRKSFDVVPSQLLLAPTGLAGGVVARGYPVRETQKLRWREWTGRIVLDWRPDLSFTNDTLLYASFARGYKGGGMNPPLPGFATLEDWQGFVDAGLLDQGSYDVFSLIGVIPILSVTGRDYGDTFKPEFVNAFEIGMKNTMMGGRLTLNAGAFFYDYKNYQVSQIRDRTAVNENFDAKMWGAELSALFEPVDRFRINANVGYLKTRIGKGMRSIDIMNRTLGDPNYTVARPWAQLTSNCVVPTPVAENFLSSPQWFNYFGLCGGVRGPIAFASRAVIDPATGQQYDVNNYPELNGGAGLYTDLSGNELPNSPRWTLNMGAEYTIPFDGGWSATPRVDGYWQAKSWHRVYNYAPYDRLKSWSNVNISLRVDGPDDLSIEAYVKNVFNKTPITDAFLNSDDTDLTTNVFTLDPRIIGFSISKKF